MVWIYLIVVVLSWAATCNSAAWDEPFLWTGVNESGLENGTTPGGIKLVQMPGVLGIDYFAPTNDSLEHFGKAGANIIRLPIAWERIQPVLNGSLDPGHLALVKQVVKDINQRGMIAVIELHNYLLHYDKRIGKDLPDALFADVWSRLASAFYMDNVMFGLINEPNNIDMMVWVDAANLAIQAIRKVTMRPWIMFEGIIFSSAGAWPDNSGPGALNVVDPANRTLMEMHQYFDPSTGYGGTDPHSCVFNPDAFIKPTAWLRANNKLGFLGEFGLGPYPHCTVVLDQVLTFLRCNSDVWKGFTVWAAGAGWWNYGLSVEPVNGVDTPQGATARKYYINGAGKNLTVTEEQCKALKAIVDPIPKGTPSVDPHPISYENVTLGASDTPVPLVRRSARPRQTPI